MKTNKKAIIGIFAAVIIATVEAHAGRWLSRDPLQEGAGFVQRDTEENAGANNLYIFCGNNGILFYDPLGLTWKVERKDGNRAHAKPEAGDTVSDLAQIIHFDNKDFNKWLIPVGPTHMPGSATESITQCSEFTVPNTVFIDFGNVKTADLWFTDVISIWRAAAMSKKTDLERSGYHVLLDETANDSEIKSHLGNANIHGYMFVGHGFVQGTINSYSHLGDNMSGVPADRYTPYGVAFVSLEACSSADSQPIIGALHRHYMFNAWESNVSTRGVFQGYSTDVNAITELFHWVVTQGKNDGGLNLDR